MIINFNLLIDIFLPNWPKLSENDLNKVKKKILANLKEHYFVLPTMLKLALNIIFILFSIYIFFITFLYIISFKKIHYRKKILFFFKINKLLFNFERFFRSIINLYFFEEIEVNYKNKLNDRN